MADKFTLDINPSNAAFADGNMGAELARILRGVADRVDGLAVHGGRDLYDINGNKVGSYYVPEDPHAAEQADGDAQEAERARAHALIAETARLEDEEAHGETAEDEP